MKPISCMIGTGLAASYSCCGLRMKHALISLLGGLLVQTSASAALPAVTRNPSPQRTTETHVNLCNHLLFIVL